MKESAQIELERAAQNFTRHFVVYMALWEPELSGLVRVTLKRHLLPEKTE